MKTLAEAKRKMQLGTKAKIVWAHYPHKYLNIEREVSLVQTNAIAFKSLDGHKGPSYLTWPKASEFVGTDKGFKILEDGKLLLEYEVIGV